jgi:hypothetical protein
MQKVTHYNETDTVLGFHGSEDSFHGPCGACHRIVY